MVTASSPFGCCAASGSPPLRGGQQELFEKKFHQKATFAPDQKWRSSFLMKLLPKKFPRFLTLRVLASLKHVGAPPLVSCKATIEMGERK